MPDNPAIMNDCIIMQEQVNGILFCLIYIYIIAILVSPLF